jgi:hypothetical protein
MIPGRIVWCILNRREASVSSIGLVHVITVTMRVRSKIRLCIKSSDSDHHQQSSFHLVDINIQATTFLVFLFPSCPIANSKSVKKSFDHDKNFRVMGYNVKVHQKQTPFISFALRSPSLCRKKKMVGFQIKKNSKTQLGIKETSCSICRNVACRLRAHYAISRSPRLCHPLSL